ncbi:MAG TPA: hypothetical protein VGG16_27835 [Streptosporangiaceae bacterium]|jgi:hypothetical protein
MRPTFELVDANIDGEDAVYGVRLLDRPRPGLLGWLQRLPSGWRRYGDNDAPIIRSLPEAIDELIECYSEEHFAGWPEDKTAP